MLINPGLIFFFTAKLEITTWEHQHNKQDLQIQVTNLRILTMRGCTYRSKENATSYKDREENQDSLL